MVVHKGMFAHSLVWHYCTSTTAPIKVDNQAGQELEHVEHDYLMMAQGAAVPGPGLGEYSASSSRAR